MVAPKKPASKKRAAPKRDTAPKPAKKPAPKRQLRRSKNDFDQKKFFAGEYKKLERSLPRSMKYLLIIVSLISALSFYFYSDGFDIHPQSDPGSLEYLCTDVIDGDTIYLIDPQSSEKLKIRMYGIDAPEKSQAFGTESTKAMKQYVLNKRVKLEQVDKDRYQRIVGKIYVDGIYVNADMVRYGYAWHYEQYAKDADLKKAQQTAQEKKVGLWGSHPKPQPPWLYRKKSQ